MAPRLVVVFSVLTAFALPGCRCSSSGAHDAMGVDGGSLTDASPGDAAGDVDLGEPADLGHAVDLALPTAGEPPPGFSLHAAHALAVESMHLASGDLDGDGRPDLVTAWGNTQLEVVHNIDGWSFAAPVDYDIGGNNSLIAAVAVADLDGDGKPEIVVANETANQVLVLHNQGGGTFATGVGYPAGSGPSTIAIGDIDGDGKPDLALGAASDGAIHVLRNRGDGTFEPEVGYTTLFGAAAIALVDLDGNGTLDLAEASSSAVTDGANVIVRLNDGHGGFAAAVRYPGATSLTSLVAADLNGDHRPELVVLEAGSPPKLGVAHVLLNQGNGTFSPGAALPADSLAQQLAVADFDGDGDLDLAIVDSWHDAVRLLTNRGDATFDVAGDYFATGTAGDIVAADFNGDHLPDIAASGFATAVLFNHGHDQFIAAAEQPVAYYGKEVAAGDLDGDGKPDAVVATGLFDATDGTDGVSVLVQGAGGTLGPPTIYPAGKWVSAVALGDLDGDHDLDVVAANNIDDTVSVLVNDGHDVLGAPSAYAAGPGPMSVVVADFNGDQALDIAVGHFGDATVSVLINDGHGAFAAPTSFAVGTKPERIAARDLDGNGSVDLVAANHDDNTISVLLNQGNGTFATAATYAAGINPSSVALGDVDGDGAPDVVVTHDYEYGERNLAVLINDGHGAFAPLVTHELGGSQSGLTIGDINGDGHADLVFTWWSGTLGIMLGDGTGAFDTPLGFVAGGAGTPVLVDLNGDQKVDVVTVGSDTCSVLRNSSR
jgi:hypothetical protein